MTNNFGPYSNPNLRLSPYGIAIKNRENKWVAYNKESGHLIDVNIINIEIDTSKLFYRIPKALKDIEVGNLLIHNNELVFVEKIENSRFEVLNPASGTVMTIVPSISPFGFDYLDAIISLTDYLPEADIDNPFGNLLPFMMMGKDNSVIALLMAMGGDIKDIDPILLLAASGNNALLMLSLMNKKTKTREKILQEKLATLQKKNNAL